MDINNMEQRMWGPRRKQIPSGFERQIDIYKLK